MAATAVSSFVAGEREPASSEFLPHVVAWNLTKKCNLQCTHCYISAGPWEDASDELTPAECLRVVDQLVEVNPSPMLILSGGEPLLRPDLPALAAHAVRRGCTVVVGTNGTLLTAAKVAMLKDAGVSGVAVSVDSLEPGAHDAFRGGSHALQRTMAALEHLKAQQLDFVIQTTASPANEQQIPQIVRWAAEQGAVCFNLYFLVPTGRGADLVDLAPARIESLLSELAAAEQEQRGAMMVRAKCAPHFIRHVHGTDPDSPVLSYRTRCPCGIDYCRITPDGKLTPCPYMPTVAGDLRRQTFGEIWRESQLLASLRERSLGGRCGRCEYRLICGGCRARALAATGDVLAEDPSCTYEPQPDRAPIPRRAMTYGGAHTATLTWDPAAQERMNKIPSFVRGVVMKRVEDFARERGAATVTIDLLKDIRSAMPVDFSKKRPFFLKDE